MPKNLQNKKPKDYKRKGRPTKITQEVIDEVCELLADGQSFWSLYKLPHLPDKATFYRWIKTGCARSKETEPDTSDLYLIFYDQYIQAKEIQAEVWASEVMDIADSKENDIMLDEMGLPMFDKQGNPLIDHNNVARAKLMVDTRKWVACKLLPKQYGEKSQVDVRQTIRAEVISEEAQKILNRLNISIDTGN